MSIKGLIDAMQLALEASHAKVLDTIGVKIQRASLTIPSALLGTAFIGLSQALSTANSAESALLKGNTAFKPEVVELMSFLRPLRQVSEAVKSLMLQVDRLEPMRSIFSRVYFPSYPLMKSLNRNNAQVRHDRGGITACELFGHLFLMFHN
jgi:hypothetical protein